MIDSLLFPWFLVLQVVIFIAECDAVVVQSDNQASILVAQRDLVLVGFVGAVETFASYHAVVVFDLPNK